MQLGMFGKLPAKGDFLTRAIPPDVLSYWESWLEKAVGGAKQHLENNWGQIYQMAPVWRFWIGPEVFGQPIAGVWAASVDRVGRQFPLTLVLSGAGVDHPVPPLTDPMEEWYGALESGLLHAQSEAFDGDVDRWIARLPLPRAEACAMGEDRRNAFFAYGEYGLDQMLTDVRDHDHQLAALGRSYWWTKGNAYVGPAMIAQDGMPDAASFAAMLRGFGPPAKKPEPEPVRQTTLPPVSAKKQETTVPPARPRETTLPPQDISHLIGGPGTPAAAAWGAAAPAIAAVTGDGAAKEEVAEDLSWAALDDVAEPVDPRDEPDNAAWAVDMTGEDAASPFGDDGVLDLEAGEESESPFDDGGRLEVPEPEPDAKDEALDMAAEDEAFEVEVPSEPMEGGADLSAIDPEEQAQDEAVEDAAEEAAEALAEALSEAEEEGDPVEDEVAEPTSEGEVEVKAEAGVDAEEEPQEPEAAEEDTLDDAEAEVETEGDTAAEEDETLDAPEDEAEEGTEAASPSEPEEDAEVEPVSSDEEADLEEETAETEETSEETAEQEPAGLRLGGASREEALGQLPADLAEDEDSPFATQEADKNETKKSKGFRGLFSRKPR
ncbi:type VI secretion system-associated protein TagF [Alphaproteobacteria bacterium KMM 3653]|uniref:Type VI secretion system-associated protein TagF n=1 Tax=Harenicola maris TaxID=2841044 RepID=A0AAP2CPI5_9RHOB|nr:type VI secretion system-associated protein TagF [Harenicola maris]